MVDAEKLEVAIPNLRWRCDPKTLGFDCTDELEPPTGFIGQERAVHALEFGLGITRRGFNIFVTGLTGSGRTTVIKSHLEEVVRQRAAEFEHAPVYDWCYVYNFSHQDQPAAVRVERGKGERLVQQVSQMLQLLKKELQSAFRSDAYKEQARALSERMNAQRQDAFKETERIARDNGFALQASAVGVAIVPVADGKPIEQSELLAMSEDAKESLERRRSIVSEKVEEAMRRVQQLESDFARETRDAERQVAEHTVDGPFRTLREEFEGNEAVEQFLSGLRDYTLHHLPPFLSSDESDGGETGDGRQSPPGGPGQARDPFLPFEVNLFVDNSDISGPPIIVEDNPTYTNVFGQIERRPVMGTYLTDHTMLRPGALVAAGGGYLVLRARDAFRHPGVWEGLKRVLRGGMVRPEDPGEILMSGFMPQGLRPQPIPIDVKVIMTGDARIYHMLSALDEEFWEIFKVRADFDFQMENSKENIGAYASLICGMVNTHGLRHFDGPGVAAVIEQGARLVADQSKLSTRFGQIRDLLIEASEWAARDSSELVSAGHVEKAVEERVYRSSLVSDRIREMIVEGDLMVDLEGSAVGQVNGLSVYSLGDVSFGRPSRITASTYMGRPGVVNIEREVKLSGSTHDKGVLILSGYLGKTFAQKHPLAVTISLAFEQSYSGIDGDSASSTELYAILSSLSGLPIQQGIAVTGSVNQMGEIQPIGGANEKIEGFFDVCRESGKLGPDVGVMIPRQNVDTLMLRQDVVEGVSRGDFRVYSVATVDEGITLLTGVDAGEPDEDGNFPEGTVNYRVATRLRELAEAMREFASSGN